jgi:hypothetical protein
VGRLFCCPNVIQIDTYLKSNRWDERSESCEGKRFSGPRRVLLFEEKWEMFVASRPESFLGGIRSGKHQGSKLWDAGALALRERAGQSARHSCLTTEVGNVCHR